MRKKVIQEFRYNQKKHEKSGVNHEEKDSGF